MNRIFVCMRGMLFAALVGMSLFPLHVSASDKDQSGSLPVLVPPQSTGYEAALDLRQGDEYARKRGYPEAVIARFSSVVRVFISVYHPDQERFLPYSLGMGFLVGNGLILSAAHIPAPSHESVRLIPPLENAFECIQVRAAIQFGGASKLPARIVWYNRDADLFVMRFAPDSLPKGIEPIPVAEDDPAVGEELYLYGFLFGGESELIMSDIPTILPPVFFRIAGEEAHGRGRFLFVQHPEFGYSGGPLFNGKGKIEGVTSAMSEGEAFGSAVSRKEILKAISQIAVTKPYCPE